MHPARSDALRLRYSDRRPYTPGPEQAKCSPSEGWWHLDLVWSKSGELKKAPGSSTEGWWHARGIPAHRSLHPALCTRHPKPDALHPAPCTLHPAHSTLNPQPSTLNPELQTLRQAEADAKYALLQEEAKKVIIWKQGYIVHFRWLVAGR